MKSDDRLDSLIKYHAEKSGLDWLRVKAHIKVEFGFVLLPEHSIMDLCYDTRRYLNMFGQDDRAAVAAYALGPDNVTTVMLRHRSEWFQNLPESVIRYVVEVNQYYVEYQHEELKRGRTGQY